MALDLSAAQGKAVLLAGLSSLDLDSWENNSKKLLRLDQTTVPARNGYVTHRPDPYYWMTNISRDELEEILAVIASTDVGAEFIGILEVAELPSGGPYHGGCGVYCLDRSKYVSQVEPRLADFFRRRFEKISNTK